MLKLTALMILILNLGFISKAEAQFSMPSARELREDLRQRKLSYEAHLASEEERRARRKAAANRHKKNREEYLFFRDQARKHYTRKHKEFPVAAYRRFIARRDQRVEKQQQARRKYQSLQQKLADIKQKNRFKINKMEEYNL